MQYKGYTAIIEFDEEAKTLYGEVIGLRDAIMFEGQSAKEISTSFEKAVDYYLEFCKSRGEEPEKPYSGKFLVRVEPDLHRMATLISRQEGKSLNGWVEDLLAKAVSAPKHPPVQVPTEKKTMPAAARQAVSFSPAPQKLVSRRGRKK